jgi:hypothetical protein
MGYNVFQKKCPCAPPEQVTNGEIFMLFIVLVFFFAS